MKESSAIDRARIALSREEMRKFGYAVVDLLTEHFAKIQEGPVGAKIDPAKIIPVFDIDPPETRLRVAVQSFYEGQAFLYDLVKLLSQPAK